MGGPVTCRWALPLLAISALLSDLQHAHGAYVKHDLRVGLMRGAPDCYPKTLIVANNKFQYPIIVTQGDTLEVSQSTIANPAHDCQFPRHPFEHVCPCGLAWARVLSWDGMLLRFWGPDVAEVLGTGCC